MQIEGPGQKNNENTRKTEFAAPETEFGEAVEQEVVRDNKTTSGEMKRY